MYNKKKFLILFLFFFWGSAYILNNSVWMNKKENSNLVRFSAIDYKNITIISDDLTYWNNHISVTPSIAVDTNGSIHIVWVDGTEGSWDSLPIMYASNDGTGWTNATVISGNMPGGDSNPSIAVDINNIVHVVWNNFSMVNWGSDFEIMYAYKNGTQWSNVSIISDDISQWNNGMSIDPSIAIDKNGKIHVVWDDGTNGAWGADIEIMYASNDGTGWSKATVISDGFNGIYWNNETSASPSIAVDSDGVIHVVWGDGTDGWWGSDAEIMYVSNSGTGWSNATVISDGFNGIYWNNETSQSPSIAVDSDGVIHVVWWDGTDGWWGSDYEIMYVSNSGTGWSNATIISDDITCWNDKYSGKPSIAVDINKTIHIVWEDTTRGIWSNSDWDFEIMYRSYNGTDWTNIAIVSDDEGGWNEGASESPCIAVDYSGKIHIAWEDNTYGAWSAWNLESEIMYRSSIGFFPKYYKLVKTISFGNIYIFSMIIGFGYILIKLVRKNNKYLQKK